MPRLQDTAYPRLKSVLTARDLAAAITPTADEWVLARRAANGSAAQLGFLVLLKLFQRLGRPVPIADATQPFVEHIARAAGSVAASLRLEGYAAQHAMIRALAETASTKYELEDLINVAIEQLVRLRFELPAFDTLNGPHASGPHSRGRSMDVPSML